MKLKKYQPILEAIATATLAFILHKLFFYLNNDNPRFQNFHTSIETLYGLFCSFSIIIIYILMLVKKHSHENVGYVFLLVTCLKMVYVFIVTINYI